MATSKERQRTAEIYNLHLIGIEDCDEYGMPLLEAYTPDIENIKAIRFRDKPEPGLAAHFFLEDYSIEGLWRQPGRYIDMLKKFDLVFTPDYSCFLDMPEPMQRWNVYRSRALGVIWQKEGINVIPTVTWGEPNTYEFAFDGIPDKATLVFSSVGLARGKDGKKLFKDGAEAACEYLEPLQVLCYGTPIEFNSNGAKVVWKSSDTQDRFNELKKEAKNG